MKNKTGFQSNFGGFHIFVSNNLKNNLMIKISDFFANNLMNQIIIIDMGQIIIWTNITAHLPLWPVGHQDILFRDIKKKKKFNAVIDYSTIVYNQNYPRNNKRCSNSSAERNKKAADSL